MSEYVIYGIFDPRRPRVVMCVGKTRQRLKARFAEYVYRARRNQRLGRRLCPSHAWILEMVRRGIRPCIRVLEVTTEADWKPRETALIAYWRKRNPQLLNVNDGGDGNEGTVKLVCECGLRRVRKANGWYYCRACQRVRNQKYEVSARGRATESVGRKRRKWWLTEKGREHKRTWNRDKRRAVKLGLTVAQYRAKSV